MFDKKRLVLLLFPIILVNFVSANFACGEVESNYDFSSSWLAVSLNYVVNPNSFTSCSVSPDENKFCCDPRHITNVPWGINKTLNAKIFEPINGYFTDSVFLNITGNGYDVFPKMTLKKALTINSPEKLLVNPSDIIFNFSADSPFILLNYTIIQDQTVNTFLLCNCSNQEIVYPYTDFGDYQLYVTSGNGNKFFTLNYNFTIAKSIDFNREFICEGCSNNYLPPETLVNVIASFSSSEYLDDYRFREYIPNDLLVLESELLVPFSDTHNFLEWQINGNTATYNYTFKTPQTNFPKRYSFFSEIESYSSSIQTVYFYFIHRYLSFLAIKKQPLSFQKIKFTNNIFNDNSEPIVFSPKQDYISQIAVFPKNHSSKNFIAFNQIKNSKTKSEYSFVIGTNVLDSNLDKIILGFNFSNEDFILISHLPDKDLEIPILSSDNSLSYPSYSILSNGGRYSIIKKNGEK